MAKELPYFKFEPNQWENGNIQICSHSEKGVFIDLCSMYWSRLGDVPYKLAVQKICGGNATAIDSLYENKIFDIIDGNIYIKYLSEQLNEFENTSEQNSKNALKGWIKRREQKELSERNATAQQPQSERNAIREDKRIEDNNIIPTESEFLEFCKTIKEFPFSEYEYSLKSKYDSWVSNGWRDGHDKKIKNWKSKIKNTLPHLKPTKKTVKQNYLGGLV